MPRLVAACVFAALAGLCGAAQEKVEKKDDPKSDNEGKIVGKWRIVEAPEDLDGKKANEELKALTDLGVRFYFDFRKDMSFGFGITSDNAELLEAIKKAGAIPVSGKYKLLAGEGVELYDLPKDLALFDKGATSAKLRIKIEGERLSVTDSSGRITKLIRMREPKKDKEPPEKK